MNKLVISAGLLAALAVGAVSLRAAPQDDADPGMPQPVAQHRWLAEGVGVWDATVTMDGPEGSATMLGVETVEMFGPFIQVSHFKGEFMGMPFEGRATTGYDTIRGKFAGTWLDTMSPWITFMEGQWDEAANTLTMRYEAPNMEGVLEKMKSVITIQDADHRTYEAWVVTDEGEVPQMSIVYSRRKAATMR